MDEVNKELEIQGFPTVSALNTIRQDMDHIVNSYPEICIVDKKAGRNVTYSYENPESSIFKLPFNDDELAQLSQCMAILSRFDGTPQMEWMHSFIERFKLSLNIDVTTDRLSDSMTVDILGVKNTSQPFCRRYAIREYLPSATKVLDGGL